MSLFCLTGNFNGTPVKQRALPARGAHSKSARIAAEMPQSGSLSTKMRKGFVNEILVYFQELYAKICLQKKKQLRQLFEIWKI